MRNANDHNPRCNERAIQIGLWSPTAVMPGAPLYLCLRVEIDLDGVLASKTSNKLLVEPQLAEDGVGVFS